MRRRFARSYLKNQRNVTCDTSSLPLCTCPAGVGILCSFHLPGVIYEKPSARIYTINRPEHSCAPISLQSWCCPISEAEPVPTCLPERCTIVPNQCRDCTFLNARLRDYGVKTRVEGIFTCGQKTGGRLTGLRGISRRLFLAAENFGQVFAQADKGQCRWQPPRLGDY